MYTETTALLPMVTVADLADKECKECTITSTYKI